MEVWETKPGKFELIKQNPEKTIFKVEEKKMTKLCQWDIVNVEEKNQMTKLYHEVINTHDSRLEEACPFHRIKYQLQCNFWALYFSTSFTTEAARSQKGSRLSEFTFQ